MAKSNFDWLAIDDDVLIEVLGRVPRTLKYVLGTKERLQKGISQAQFAHNLDIDIRTVQRALAKSIEILRKRGVTGDTEYQYVPPPHFLKGQSTYYKIDPDTGEKTAVAQWHKTDFLKEQKADSLKDFVEGMKAEIPVFAPKPKTKDIKRDDLMPSIFIGDAHIGMRAFGKETKHSDFDTGIATSQIRDAIDYLVDKAEFATNGLLVDVGDYTHANGSSNTTFAGTPLDVDTRHRSTLYAAAMTMRYSIDRMLEKVDNLYVIIAKGNHNNDVAPAIELMLSFCYEKEPRVHIQETHGYYHYFEYGKWLLGVTHGDKQPAERLAGSMARDMSEAWGRTLSSSRMWCTGHYHKEAVKVLAGVKHKVFAALPPPDAWHSSHGYSGDGEMEMMTFRKEGGVHSSHVYTIPQPKREPDVRIK